MRATDTVNAPSTHKNNSRHGHRSAVPHDGGLCHLEDGHETYYTIAVTSMHCHHELVFTRNDLTFAQRLFCILDTETTGFVDQAKVREFTTQRCPVFWRRDDDLRKLKLSTQQSLVQRNSSDHQEANNSPTFDEIWESVMGCSQTPVQCEPQQCELGLEGWMVFCRFIALAQYLEAKRRFSARHLQQTMRHRNSPRGSEVIMVEVPPPEPPSPLSLEQLASYEQRSQSPLPLPELDLDHSLLAVHDSMRRPTYEDCSGRVSIDLFGYRSNQQPLSSSSSSAFNASTNLEFAVSFTRPQSPNNVIDHTVVRRSMADMKWLDDTVTSHKTLGGTLCGRILPPFPSSGGNRMILSHFQSGEDSLLHNSIVNSTGGAIAAAAKSVGKFRNAAKTLIGSYLSGSTGSLPANHMPPPSSNSSGTSAASASTQSSSMPKKTQPSRHASIAKHLPESYYNPHSPNGKARQIERYLNYLLDHPALSTSFPLNAVLTASESGLEAAKKSIEECNKAAKELKEQTPHLVDGGKLWPSMTSGESNNAPNFAWVRTAAQAAMALRVHGMLETTGMPSASARLQHASLPSFGKTKQGLVWEDDSAEEQQRQGLSNENSSTDAEGHSFEEGVVRVQSELQSENEFQRSDDDGYDLLPLPVPAPERRILTVGNSSSSTSVHLDSRFHYGSVSAELDFLSFESNDDDSKTVLLGNMLVDDNIDKLREVIGSVDSTLSRCLGSSGCIGAARCERLKIQLDVIRGLDSWEAMRGQFVSQRALLRGVGGMSQSREIYEESDLILVDDLSWQASLAHSAVSAAEDVRSAIRASRTAGNAKAAANSAAMSAQAACDGNFPTIEEARAAQTRSSIAQSHAIHAAVVDHETKAVKRQATLAFAHDVKCWNSHRKGELLRSCLSYAKSQHEATRRAVDAWSTLRDGFLDTPLIPSTYERKTKSPPQPQSSGIQRPATDPDEVVATIFESPGQCGQPSIVASEHLLFNPPAVDDSPDPSGDLGWDESHMPDQTDPDISTAGKSADFCDSKLILPFATASPISDENEEAGELLHSQHKVEARPNEETLSASMQSLVDGLMSWGGGLDVDEDHMALPPGMAASIALEETGAMLQS